MNELSRGFYRELKWDPETAAPSKESLEKLGLEDVNIM